MGFEYSNNHTHLEKFKGQWYLFHHTMNLQKNAGSDGGFRSLAVDKIEIDENAVSIKMSQATNKGPDAIANLNPDKLVSGTCMVTCSDIIYENEENPKEVAAKSKEDGTAGIPSGKNPTFGLLMADQKINRWQYTDILRAAVLNSFDRL